MLPEPTQTVYTYSKETALYLNGADATGQGPSNELRAGAGFVEIDALKVAVLPLISAGSLSERKMLYGGSLFRAENGVGYIYLEQLRLWS